MPDKSNDPFQFWGELKRRRVIRVITVYAAAAFVLLELVDIISEPFGLPDWTLKLVTVLLVIGFIISVILSWIYDVTPEGIEKTKSSKEVANAEESPASKGWKIATFVSVVIIVVFVVFYIIGNIKRSSDISKLEKSIAVLPFENWSYEEEYSHYGNAIANEIITELYNIKGFRVLSHTSTLQYTDSKKSIPVIGQELGVNYIIEGIIERQGDEVNIHVQVIRAKNEDNIWADEFDGNWKEIFQIQDEIAFKVAQELKTVLSPEQIEQIEKKPTDNSEAYSYYLLGNDYYWGSYEAQDWSSALKIYQKAIDLDPDFALAYSSLAESHLMIYWFHFDRSKERLEKSKKAIDAAFAIDPDLTEAHVAQATYYYRGFLDYSKALEELEFVLDREPDNSKGLYIMATVYRRMGEFEKSKEVFLKSMYNDPKNPRILLNTAQTFGLLREYPEAIKLIDLALGLNPEFVETYRDKINLLLNFDGNTVNARKTLEDASLFITPSSNSVLVECAIQLDIIESNFMDALDFLNTTNFDAVQPQFYYYPNALYYAMIYDLMKDTENATSYYSLARDVLEKRIRIHPEDSRLYGTLGICMAGLGEKGKAINLGKKSAELLPVSKEAWRGLYRIRDLARIYVMVGEYELAIEQLDYILSVPGILSANLLQIDPIWKPLWELPEFAQLIEKYSEK